MTVSHKNKDTNSVYIKSVVRMNEDTPQASSVWLVSFTDVIALMLTFFVLLYSMSSPDSEKWEYKVGVPLSPVAEYSGPSQNAGVNEGQNINRIDYNNADDRDYVEALLREILNGSGTGDNFMITQEGADVKLTIPNIVFDQNGNQINEQSSAIFNQLAPVLDNLDNQIKITTKMASDDDDNLDAYRRMVLIAQTLRDARYKKPITIGMTGRGNQISGQIHILIQPHDGRRITR